MASRAVLQEQPRGAGVQQKKGQGGERRNRTALGDIGNLVPPRVAPGGKQVNRPITRSFCAQLLANAQQAAEKNKKQGEQVADVGGGGKRGVAAARKAAIPQQKKLQEKQKELSSTVQRSDKKEVKQASHNKKNSPSFTSFLTARSKEACGVTKKPEIVNIDEDTTNSEHDVVEYVEDIFKYYKEAEHEGQVTNYMGMQPDINERMRSILVDWLIEVHFKFELRPETLYLTINIIDRFLAMKVVPRKELQLVGISSMLIACKYEEIWAPEVNDFVCISDKAYIREQVLGMEKAILGKLEWYLTVPTPYMFLTRYVKAASSSSSVSSQQQQQQRDVDAQKKMENMVFFLAELGIMHYSTIVKYCPSLIAAACVYAARCTLNETPSWTDTLKHYTGYSEHQLRECAKVLVGYHSMAEESKLKAVHKKFSKPEMGAVALCAPAKTLLCSSSS